MGTNSLVSSIEALFSKYTVLGTDFRMCARVAFRLALGAVLAVAVSVAEHG